MPSSRFLFSHFLLSLCLSMFFSLSFSVCFISNLNLIKYLFTVSFLIVWIMLNSISRFSVQSSLCHSLFSFRFFSLSIHVFLFSPCFYSFNRCLLVRVNNLTYDLKLSAKLKLPQIKNKNNPKYLSRHFWPTTTCIYQTVLSAFFARYCNMWFLSVSTNQIQRN